jgi:prepilin-type N-terminal cleavage/methylation domain-containing protein
MPNPTPLVDYGLGFGLRTPTSSSPRVTEPGLGFISAFTLIELLLVIAIIAILAALLRAGLNRAKMTV